MKKYALVLCAVLMAFGVSAVATAQAAGEATAAGAVPALGNAQTVDETTLAIGAEPAAAQGADGKAALPSNLFYFLRMILVLAFVLGAMYLVFRLIKKLGKPKAGDDSTLRILASKGLGTGRALHVVALGKKAWLLGSTDASVNLIDRIEDTELLDELTLRATSSGPAPRGDFAAVLGSLLGKKKGGSHTRAEFEPLPPGEEPGADYLARQRERLKKLRP